MQDISRNLTSIHIKDCSLEVGIVFYSLCGFRWNVPVSVGICMKKCVNKRCRDLLTDCRAQLDGEVVCFFHSGRLILNFVAFIIHVEERNDCCETKI